MDSETIAATFGELKARVKAVEDLAALVSRKLDKILIGLLVAAAATIADLAVRR